MDESGGEKPQSPNVNRRKAIIATVGFMTGTAGVIATKTAKDLLSSPQENPASGKTSIDERITTRVSRPEPFSPSIDEINRFVSTNHMFNNCNNDELAQASNLVDTQIKHYTKAELVKRMQDTLKNQSYMFSAAEILENQAAGYILPLIFVESSGNPLSRTNQDPTLSEGEKQDSDRPQGLCQIKPSTARQILPRLTKQQTEKLGIIGNNPDLSNPVINIAMALEYNKWLYEVFDDHSLSTWAYHLGPGNLKNLIQTYLTVNNLVDANTIQEDFKNDKWVQNLKKYVHGKYQLNSVKLINFVNDTKKNGSPAMNKYLSNLGVEGDDTQHYVTRIAAADYLLTRQTKA